MDNFPQSESNDPPPSSPLGSDPLGHTRRQFIVGVTAASVVISLPASGQVDAHAQSTVGKGDQPGAVPVRLRVNGVERKLELDPRITLLDLLREHLYLTGTKKGCDHGQCGACTVLVGGERINSCLSLAVTHEGDEITTIEGLSQQGAFESLRNSFLDQDAFQCGYCTSGQLCAAVALIKEGHTQSDDEIREWMSGNLCRCGAYPNIVAAIRQATHKQGVAPL